MMNSYKTKLLTIFIVLLLILTSGIPVFASDRAQISVTYAPIHFVYDGKEYAPPEDQKGFIYKGRTYVPIRFISYMLGKEIDWDGDTYTASVRKPQHFESILIDEYNLNTLVRNSEIKKVDTSTLKSTSIDVSFRQVTYVFHDEIAEPPADYPGLIYKSRIYVPMRFFSDSLGVDIDWDPNTYSVIAQSEAYSKQLKLIEEELGEAIDPMLMLPGMIGSGSGGTPTASSIDAVARTQIAVLQEQAMQYFLALLTQYNEANAQEKLDLKSQGMLKLAQFDEAFAVIINTLRTDLTTYGYDTAIADQYEQEYEAQKALAQSIVGN